MNSEKLDKLLDNLTSGLDGDLEVKLDVRNELQAHLEDKIAAGKESGLSEAESIEEAIKSFGDTIAVSDGLIEANFSRMKFKVRLYKIAMILLIPAVIFCAFISFASFFDKLWTFSPNAILRATIANIKTGWFDKKLTPDESLILYGDRTKKSKHDQQKAIWARFPEDKVYLANYILSLQGDNKISNETMLEELQKAKKIDPENALYNYLTAAVLLKKGCIEENKRISYKDKKTGRLKRKNEYFIKIKNPEYMDFAVKEYLAGTNKKSFHCYAWEMKNKRLAIFGQPDLMTDNIRQFGIFAATLLPHLVVLRSIPRAIWQYAGILQKEGKQAEALIIADSWEKYVRQITDDSHFLIEILVDAAVLAVAQNNIPNIYKKAGLKQAAQRADARMTCVKDKIQAWKEGRKKHIINQTQMDKVGALGALLIPALGGMDEYSDDDMAVSRRIEYVGIDNRAILILNIVLFIVMTGALAGSYYWRRQAGRKALLLAPGIKFTCKLLLLGIILPLSVYFVLSATEILGGHNYNIMHSFINLVAQWFLLLTVIPMIILALIKRKVSNRCLELELATPGTKPRKIALSIKILFLTVFIFFALFPVKMLLQSWESIAQYIITVGAILSVSLITFGVHVVYCLIKSLLDKRHALYYGAICRILVLLLGLSIIFITTVVKPYLVWREASLMKQDKIIYGHPTGFTELEYKVTMKLKKMILDCLNNPEK